MRGPKFLEQVNPMDQRGDSRTFSTRIARPVTEIPLLVKPDFTGSERSMLTGITPEDSVTIPLGTPSSRFPQDQIPLREAFARGRA